MLTIAADLRHLGARIGITAVLHTWGSALGDAERFKRLPIGSEVRILPNHACLTFAAYPSYDVLRDGAVVTRWDRVNGW